MLVHVGLECVELFVGDAHDSDVVLRLCGVDQFPDGQIRITIRAL